ncbi:DUF3570 domain-containing protein [Methylotuvimicrobium sp. KM1]|uniref:DUF3570 domain-containing protein n=1 Tax=Methylotuvimicrobium sp. KM1 TaxID=3377707 RepID=UPI00384FA0AB
MAVTEKDRKANSALGSLQALTAAALILPGLAPAQAAEDNEFSFQYGRYEESKRDLGEVNSQFDPITVDSLQASARVRLTDRIKFAFNYIQDTWSGATPITTAPSSRQGNVAYEGGAVAGASPYFFDGPGGSVYFDAQRNPVKTNRGEISTFLGNFPILNGMDLDRRNVHTMSVASPEVRKEGNFNLTYEWDEATVSAGGGLSIENDYESRFANLGLTLDFNQKMTTLSAGLSYANSSTSARLNHDAQPFLNTLAYEGGLPHLHPKYAKLQDIPESVGGQRLLRGKREDWAVNLGLTQVVTKSSLAKFGAGYTRSTGYLSNPYKAVTAFFLRPVGYSNFDIFDPDFNINLDCGGIECGQGIVYEGKAKAFMEQRPEVRNQWSFNTGWVQYVGPLDAAMHFDYRFYHDDWGINAHTFEADWVQPLRYGWTITPRIRYYSQSEADFYTPFLLAGPSDVPDSARESSDNAKLPTQTFSSDHRLSGYGALSGGVSVSKQFTKGVRFDAGLEYYTHQGSLKIGGGGEPDYADFDYWVANGSVSVEFSAIGRSLTDHDHHHHDMTEHEPLMPAGLMCVGGHMLNQEGDFMVGYVYQYLRETGNMLNRTSKASDAAMVNNGYRTIPTFHDMHMHMIDLMYAPTDWFNIMVMPMFMDMNMDLRPLSGLDLGANTGADHLHGGHQTGGIGDTLMFGMFKLFKHRGHHINLGLGFSAPTGDVDKRLNRQHGQDGGLIHYQMQLGSGTWDFLPSLTYLGQYDKFSWGAQANATVRMQNRNDSGYRLGNMFQASAWGSYSFLSWLSGSVRGVYTVEGSIKGRFNPLSGQCPDWETARATNEPADLNNPVACDNVNPFGSTLDHPQNYGGRFWDVGFGLNVVVPGGEFSGNHLSVEWLQPVHEDVNGFQLERKGTLFATWSYMF